MLLLSRIVNERKTSSYPQNVRKLPKRDCAIKRCCNMAILNQHHKLRKIKMKRLSLLKQKLVETLKI